MHSTNKFSTASKNMQENKNRIEIEKYGSSQIGSVAGYSVNMWVVQKYDFNENPVVNFDFDLGLWTPT